MQTVLETDHLSHIYSGNHKALDQLSFTVHTGEVVGLLGPNGAGKTTTVRLANGLFPPSSGQMQVLGLNPVTQGDQIRLQTGVLTETPALYERLTARDNLDFFATLAGMPAGERKIRIEELLKFFDLEERANEHTAHYSKGMKQRLALARALLQRPPLIFLDEPTSGLDPEASQQVHDLINTLHQNNGQTVILCTHNLTEAERLCDRLAIMNHGRLLAIGSLDELRSQVTPEIWLHVEIQLPLSPSLLESLKGMEGISHVEMITATSFRAQIMDGNVTPSIVSWLVYQEVRIMTVLPQYASLEDIYFKLQSQQQAGNE
jgi:ABC-2 type transport system ATP-binding protein